MCVPLCFFPKQCASQCCCRKKLCWHNWDNNVNRARWGGRGSATRSFICWKCNWIAQQNCLLLLWGVTLSETTFLHVIRGVTKVDSGVLGSASSSLNFWPNLLPALFLLERSKNLLREAEWFCREVSTSEFSLRGFTSDELPSTAEIKVPEGKCGWFLRPRDLKSLAGFSAVVQTVEVCRTYLCLLFRTFQRSYW